MGSRYGVALHFIRPGNPIDNAFVESFIGKFRDECLNENSFLDLDDARRKIEDWQQDFNTVRLHSSLGDRTQQAMPRADRQNNVANLAARSIAIAASRSTHRLAASAGGRHVGFRRMEARHELVSGTTRTRRIRPMAPHRPDG
jgi:hypothetical protein